MGRCLAFIVLAACGDNLHPPATASSIVVSPDFEHPGRSLPADFLGVSYETSTLLPDANGNHYFDPQNHALVATFATLGIASLRLGGIESEVGPLPAPADITAALDFVSAANVDLIYTLRMATYDPQGASLVAQLVLSNAPTLRCFSLGNEAMNVASYTDYASDASAYMFAIGGTSTRYCAPDTFGASWPVQFATEFAPTGQVSAADVHAYFGGAGDLVQASVAREVLLSNDIVGDYAMLHDSLVSGLAPTGVPFRLSETNSYSDGGCSGASDAFASALWGLDYLSWWAAHDADGINFHTGDHVSGATTTYSLFKTSSTGYHVHPLGYAVKAFALAGPGAVVPVATDPVDGLTAYAIAAPSGELTVIAINKTHDAAARAMSLAIATPFAHAEQWTLDAGGDITVSDGVTLGGAPIGDDASWSGTSTPVSVEGGIASVMLAPASATIVRMSP